MGLQKVATKLLRRCVLDFRRLGWKIHKRFGTSVTVSTRQGIFTILLGAEDAVGRHLYYHRQFELDLMAGSAAFLRGIGKCPPKGQGTIVDVGANNGVISVGMLYTGEFERAIAIEPEPGNFSLLERNVAQNGFQDRAVCLPYAVSDRQGEVCFELSEVNSGDHRVRAEPGGERPPDRYGESARRAITVESDTLDSLLTRAPEAFSSSAALVWVDVQGFEGYVFAGAGKLLSTGVPVVAEIWPYGIRHAGMSPAEFCKIAQDLWSGYWVQRRGKFVRYPIGVLDVFFDELGDDGDYDNVIFTK